MRLMKRWLCGPREWQPRLPYTTGVAGGKRMSSEGEWFRAGGWSPNLQAVTGTLIRSSDITEGRTTTVGLITTALILTAPRRFISQRTRSWSGDKRSGGWGAMRSHPLEFARSVSPDRIQQV